MRNVLYVIYYRLLRKSGLLKRKFKVQKILVKGPVFSKCSTVPDFPEDWELKLLQQADDIMGGLLPYYSHHWMQQSTPPNWFLNPFNGKECQETGSHWTQISDFNGELGDIKNVWEASRFSWLGILARAFAVSGKRVYLDTLNLWLSDWMEKNPVNQGPNWKCGQEASYRVFALLNAANILDQAEAPSGLLMAMIRLHLERIYLNIEYAFAQRNNHATSEAAALFVGGNWLLKVLASDQQEVRIYAKKGRKALERLVRVLSYEDGSFTQHSVVYHRLFLDTLSTVVFWTRKLVLQEFTPEFYAQAQKAWNWLYALSDASGNSPNLGSNDGTLLQSNHSCDYRDFRPSLQLASVLLHGIPAFAKGSYNEALNWYGIKNYPDNKEALNKLSQVFKSGYVIMNGGASWALLRFPFYKFRPAHNDALHFDLWAEGKNLLFDSGSYSYNPEPGSKVPDLKSVHAHNTLSFDHMEQMPRLGRFLLGKWLRPHSVGQIVSFAEHSGSWEGSYKDAFGNMHLRRITWNDRQWEILDRFSGDAANVEIGFNFDECEYSLDQKTGILTLPWGRITVSTSSKLAVRSHMASQYYLQYLDSSRLVISAKNNSELTTTINIF
ncbi:MAG: heparinase [Bacteroidia bacterium]|nr:MAG: heparinase [Bacteroidia bacterium]